MAYVVTDEREVSAWRVVWRQQGHGQSDRTGRRGHAGAADRETQPNRIASMPDPSTLRAAHHLGGDLCIDKFDVKTGKLTPNDPPSVSVKAKAGARHWCFPQQAVRLLVNELDASIYVLRGCQDLP